MIFRVSGCGERAAMVNPTGDEPRLQGQQTEVFDNKIASRQEFKFRIQRKPESNKRPASYTLLSMCVNVRELSESGVFRLCR
jgi:hypothetical protein